MIFKDAEGKVLNITSINMLIEEIKEKKCSCGDGECKYCRAVKYNKTYSVEEKLDFIVEEGYEYITIDEAVEKGYSIYYLNDKGEPSFCHACDECGKQDWNFKRVSKKYCLCSSCGDKRSALKYLKNRRY